MKKKMMFPQISKPSALSKFGFLSTRYGCFFTLFFSAVYASQVNSQVSATDFASTPPTIGSDADPFVMINLSVELTQQAEAYTDAPNTVYANGTNCGNARRNGTQSTYGSGWGVCYTSAEEYIGYFDPNKCYQYIKSDNSVYHTSDPTYTAALNLQTSVSPYVSGSTSELTTISSDYFKPHSITEDRTCPDNGTLFSGNFMNWATMTAIDEFRHVMTGGARVVDTIGGSATTMLSRAHRFGDWGFVRKLINDNNDPLRSTSQNGADAGNFINQPENSTPWNPWTLEIHNNNGNSNRNRVEFRRANGTVEGRFNVIVQVCDPSVGLEDNCQEYTDGTNTWYKPEGEIQGRSNNMRFALMTYTGEDSITIDGGVLRSPPKYVGYMRPAVGGGIELNPAAEINQYGQFVFNPDAEPVTSAVNNSGLINYINNFALRTSSSGYKSFDPVSEMYYQSLRFLMGIAPDTSNEYDRHLDAGFNEDHYDNFPIFSYWDAGAGQVREGFEPILDQCQLNYSIFVGDIFAHRDHTLPGVGAGLTIDSDFDTNVAALTTGAGETGSNTLDETLDARIWTNAIGTLEGIGGAPIGERFISNGRDNGYWVAGLAYWANVNDIRPDIEGKQTVRTFSVDTQEYQGNGATLGTGNQFWLAAKYGGFQNNNDSQTGFSAIPDESSEWDENGDGTPDTFTLASEPDQLRAGIRNAFAEIQGNIGAGSAAAVVANTGGGEGAIYQALYSPELTSGSQSVEWVGRVHALFIDGLGQLREDNGSTQGRLDSSDSVVEIFFDEIESTTRFRRFNVDANGEKSTEVTDFGDDSLTGPNFTPIWNASEVLGDLTDAQLEKNRATFDNSITNPGRHIFTAIDRDADGLVTQADNVSATTQNDLAIPFQIENTDDGTEGFKTSDFGFLGLGPDATAEENENLISFIRGKEGIPGTRSRTLNGEKFILGDVVHSSPVVVGAPNANFDLLFGDETYRTFVQHYGVNFKRRQMVYVGANDGMLHAFNAGVVDLSTDIEFDADGHALGAEVWAYVPYNLLPHLQWLAEPSYPHVYYVDGEVQTFDVKIFDDEAGNCTDSFTEDCVYINGWGTIIVVGMRFGGGEYSVDHDNNPGTDERVLRSAYIIMDVTNPDKEPRLIAEITHDQLGFATSAPTVVKRRTKGSSGQFGSGAGSENDWYLVFGSGPFGNDAAEKRLAFETGVSFQDAKYFLFDLKAGASVTAHDLPSGNFSSDAFIGGFAAADWNGDFTDDVLYFGTVEGGVSNPDGKLMRATLSFGGSLSLNDSIFVQEAGDAYSLPISATPTVYIDNLGENWVYAGTGRFLTEDDNETGDLQHFYFGAKEQNDSYTGTLDFADLADTSDIAVFEDGQLLGLTQLVDSDDNFDPIDTGSPAVVNINGSNVVVDLFASLVIELQADEGWRTEIPRLGERNTTQAAIFRESLLYTSYDVPGTSCEIGEGYFYAPALVAGVPAPSGALGIFNNSTGALDGGDDVNQVRQGVELGPGLPSKPQVIGDKAITQSSTGELNVTPLNTGTTQTGRQTWIEIPVTF